MTAVEWLIDNLEKYEDYAKISYRCLGEIEIALEMEKQQHGKTWDSAIEQGEKRAWNLSRLYTDFDDYYAETYGCKGSDEPNGKKVLSALKDFRDSLTEEEKEIMFKGSDDHIVDTNEMVSSQTEHNSPKVENKDSFGEISSQTEISDEEIEQYAKRNAFQYYEFITGAKWYREQLKSK